MDEGLLTDSVKENIREELGEIVGTLIAGCEALDMDMAFGMFSDSPGFLMMGTDGYLCDRQTYVDNNIAYLTACSDFELTTRRKEIRILDRDTAILSWAYKVAATLKTGERDIVDKAGASFVFRRVDGEWKVVYYHESSAPPQRIPAEK